jgi:acyl-CoA thioesterase-1
MSMSKGRKFRGAHALLLAVLAACGGASGDDGNVNAGTVGTDSVTAGVTGTEPRSLNVVFVGTSLTAGLGLEPEEAFPGRIEAKIDSAGLPYTVINAGISGETSSGLLRRLDWLLEGEFDVIVVETGANDGLRGIPIETARQNIDSALGRIRAARPGAAVVLVQMEAPPNFGAAYTDAFRRMYAELGRAHGATVMPFLLDGVAGDPALNQPDGIHPNPEGAQRVAENVWAVLGPVLETRSRRVDAPLATP